MATVQPAENIFPSGCHGSSGLEGQGDCDHGRIQRVRQGSGAEVCKIGAHVVLAARRNQILEDLAKECEAAGGRRLDALYD